MIILKCSSQRLYDSLRANLNSNMIILKFDQAIEAVADARTFKFQYDNT